MKIRYVVFLLVMICFLPSVAQNETRWEEYYQRWLENNEQMEETNADAYETLSDLQTHPLNLNTATREDLDAVIAVHVMRGADNDTGGGVKSAGEISDAWGRHHAEQMCIHTCRRKPGGDSVFQHIAGNTGVLADNDLVASEAVIAQHLADSPAEMHDEIRRHRGHPDLTAHAIRAEIFPPCPAHE